MGGRQKTDAEKEKERQRSRCDDRYTDENNMNFDKLLSRDKPIIIESFTDDWWDKAFLEFERGYDIAKRRGELETNAHLQGVLGELLADEVIRRLGHEPVLRKQCEETWFDQNKDGVFRSCDDNQYYDYEVKTIVPWVRENAIPIHEHQVEKVLNADYLIVVQVPREDDRTIHVKELTDEYYDLLETVYRKTKACFPLDNFVTIATIKDPFALETMKQFCNYNNKEKDYAA